MGNNFINIENNTLTKQVYSGKQDDYFSQPIYSSDFLEIEDNVNIEIQENLVIPTKLAWDLTDFSIDIAYEVDIFSELDDVVFSVQRNKQMSSLMESFKSYYYKKIKYIKTIIPIPKLKYFNDTDGADMVQLSYTWEQGNVMLYFSFEKDPKESSYGLIWDDKPRKNYESRIRNITLNKTDDIIHEVCEFIFRVFC